MALITLNKLALPTGSILQTVSASFQVQDTTTSSTYSNSSITANITPSSTSNKIYVSASFRGGCLVGDRAPRYAIFRDSTNITGSSSTEGNVTYIASGGQYRDNITIEKLDTPSSTSQLTYVLKFRCQDATTNTTYAGDNGGISTITLTEIKG